MHPDSRPPTDAQRKALCHLMMDAFTHIRVLGWSGEAQHAADVADAFHNLPVLMWQDNLSLRWFRDDLVARLQKNSSEAQRYVARIDAIIAMQDSEIMT
jgi:hypothetical protein